MDKNNLKVLGFAGSLRRGSYNKALLRAAADLTPDYMHLEIFNQDTEQNIPDKVKEFKTKIREADGILIATPEYNFSVPGVLKNAKVTLGFLVFDNIIMAINALMQYVRRIRR